jgi:hypothetical protein
MLGVSLYNNYIPCSTDSPAVTSCANIVRKLTGSVYSSVVFRPYSTAAAREQQDGSSISISEHLGQEIQKCHEFSRLVEAGMVPLSRAHLVLISPLHPVSDDYLTLFMIDIMTNFGRTVRAELDSPGQEYPDLRIARALGLKLTLLGVTYHQAIITARAVSAFPSPGHRVSCVNDLL